MMIPKIIHYCWFGGKPKPELALKCIESWKKYLPDYTIKEWNESNFDVNMILYTREAYQAKKYAFVSDYARFWILYHYGGLYFDTDVEIIKDFTPIIETGSFMGCEKTLCHDDQSLGNYVAAGVGMGAEKGMDVYKQVLDCYEKRHFLCKDGSLNTTTVVAILTDLLKEHGFDPKNKLPEKYAGITIYPYDYFCPMDLYSRKLSITENTYAIHHYMASWSDYTPFQKWKQKMKHRIIPMLPRFFVNFVLDYKAKKRQSKYADERMKE